MLYFNESVSHQFGGNVKSILTIWRKSLSQLLWATFGTPRGMALTPALLPISVCSFHEHIYAESQRMFPCSLVSASFCYDKTKRQPGFVAYSQGFKKKKKKTCADDVRIMQSDERSVFLLAVSRNNLSLNKTEDWRDKIQKKRACAVDFSACSSSTIFFFLDNGSAKMWSVCSNQWVNLWKQPLKTKTQLKKNTISILSKSPVGLEPPFNDI